MRLAPHFIPGLDVLQRIYEMMSVFDQSEFDVRCEWGEQGVKLLAPISDVLVIVDVLSFSTSVEIAVCQGAVVYPYRWRDERVYEYAREVKAEVASPKNERGYSLSPSTLEKLPNDFRMVLPSPNGSALTLLASDCRLLCGCLRNAQAVARAASRIGKSIGIVPCGERWHVDYSLRPSFEDFLGAGAIISELNGRLSPEAEMARIVFERFQDDLLGYISRCSSGKEKLAKGKNRDIELASGLNVSNCVPVFHDGAYRRQESAEQTGGVNECSAGAPHS